MGSRRSAIDPRALIPSLRWLLAVIPVLFVLLSVATAQTGKPSSTPAHKPHSTPPTKPSDQSLDTLQQHYDAARTYSLAGDQEHASLEYKAFLGEALRRMANARVREGMTKEGIQLFQDAIAITPKDADLRLDYVTTCLDADLPDEAKTQAEEAVKLAPESARAQYMLGHVFYDKGDYAAAKPHLEAAVAAKPNFDMGYLLGMTYLKLDDLNHARLLFDEMIAGLGNLAPLRVYFGHAYWETSHFDKAIAEYKLALSIDPKVKQAHYFLGMAYLSRDEDKGWDEAAQEDREEIKNNPDDFRPHYDLGNIALKQHHAEEAERELKRAAELAPDDPDPLIYLGEIYAGQNRPQEAEATMRKAIALTGTDVSRAGYQINRAHYVLGRVLMQTGRREEGAKELKLSAELREQMHPEGRTGKQQPLLSAKENEVRSDSSKSQMSEEDRKQLEGYLEQLKPGIADAYNNLGVASAGQKDFKTAVDYFQKAAKWSPGLPTLDRNIGMAAFYLGQYDQAIPPLYRQLGEHPDDLRVRAALGLSYFAGDKFAPTLETLGPIKDQVNDDPALGLAYAVSLIKTNQYDDGMARLKALENTASDSAGVHVALGEAYADQKMYGTAIDEFRKAIGMEPNQARTHFLLGLALMHQETEKEASEEFRASLKLDPNNAETKYHLAYTLIQIQQKEEGLALLREVVQQDPNYADAYYQLGKLQLEQGDTKAAITSLETGTKLAPNSEYIHYQLAMAYRRDSRNDDATREMQLYESMKKQRRGNHEAQSPN